MFIAYATIWKVSSLTNSDDVHFLDIILKMAMLRQGMYMVVACTLPGLCTLIPTLAAGPPNSSFNVFQHGVWALREIMNWAFAGVIVLYALRLSTRGWLIAVRLAGRCSRHHQLICSLLMPMILTLTHLGLPAAYSTS